MLSRILLGAAGVLVSYVSFTSAQSNGTLDFNNCCSNAQEATAFAIGYGTPLVAYANFTAALLEAVGGPNKIIKQPTLSTPVQKNVVKPNVDTIYTISFIDLSQSDLEITIPTITDGRYWSFPFYDPYGNNFATLSSISGAPFGTYLLRRADDAHAQPGLEISTTTAGCIPKYKGVISFPTTYGSLVTRFLVRENTTQDLNTVREYQNGVSISSVPRTMVNFQLPRAPVLTPDLLDTSNIIDQNQKALELTARLGLYNQPEVGSDRYRVGTILGQAGIVNGRYSRPAGVDLDDAYQAVQMAVQATVQSPNNLNIQTNGWVLQNLDSQGDFMLDYAARYYIAINGYLQLVPREAQYPTWAPAQLLGTSLQARQAYLLTFFGRPPTLPLPGTTGSQGGFWSVTAYGPDQFLIDNPLDRYEIGDRSNITYSDGTLVYPTADTMRTNQTSSGDKQFQVLIQPSDVRPPANWTSNWLPAPAGGGELLFLLRWYAPSEQFTNGQYQYPLVEQIDAIV